ncbi:sulfotransferase [Salinibacter ruber]|uniref:sulfotransferase n=1 Tax=Salinibacter ruber TaxID=146919 RepID=UPI002169FE7E|nr:sulfotransferase [Salinibacter ruber]MCS4223595.1 hypothetical protein [Salinibacter ruber]
MKPVFVVGSARNGTTWLSNLIASHQSISCVQHEAHWGIHESKIYEHYKYFGRIESTNDIIKFSELYTSTDYFNIAGLDDSFFYENASSISNFYDAFHLMMDKFAERSNNNIWLTKLSPKLLTRKSEFDKYIKSLSQRYEEYLFVSVKRRFNEVLPSYLNMQGRADQKRKQRPYKEVYSLFETIRYAVHYKSIYSYFRPTRIKHITFEELKNNKQKEINNIFSFLGVSSKNDIKTDYNQNSSYYSSENTVNVDGWFLALAKYLVIPFIQSANYLGKSIIWMRDYSRSKNEPFSWRLLKMDHMKPDFLYNLYDKKQYGLYEILK